MTLLVAVVIVALCVASGVFTFVQYRAGVRAGTIEPARTRDRVPTERGWRYWSLPNFERGESWPLWYWLTILTVVAALAVAMLRSGNCGGALLFALWAVMAARAALRRLLHGFHGPARTPRALHDGRGTRGDVTGVRGEP